MRRKKIRKKSFFFVLSETHGFVFRDTISKVNPRTAQQTEAEMDKRSLVIGDHSLELQNRLKMTSMKIYKINRKYKRETTLLIKNLEREQARIQKYLLREVSEIWKDQGLVVRDNFLSPFFFTCEKTPKTFYFL